MWGCGVGGFAFLSRIRTITCITDKASDLTSITDENHSLPLGLLLCKGVSVLQTQLR